MKWIIMKRNLFSVYFCSVMLITSACHAMNASQIQTLPYPYNTVQTLLPFDGHGWYANAVWIEKLMRANKIQTVVEVGSWLGCSTRHIASLLPSNGKLYAIDTWEGSVEHFEKDLGVVDKLPTLFQQFLSNTIHAGLTDIIVPIRASSVDAVSVIRHFGNHFDLIYIDAAHDTESVYKDLVSYFPFVVDNEGILCGDDWWWESVRIAVLRFAQEHELTVYAYYNDSNFWFLKNEGQYQLKSMLHAPDEAWKFSKK